MHGGADVVDHDDVRAPRDGGGDDSGVVGVGLEGDDEVVCVECVLHLVHRKKHVEKFLERHHAQEVAAGFLGKTIVGRISVMCLRGEAVVPRCLVRYGSTGRNGRVLGVTGRFDVGWE